MGKQSLKYYRKSGNVDEELAAIIEEGEEAARRQTTAFRFVQLFSPELRRATFIACSLQVGLCINF